MEIVMNKKRISVISLDSRAGESYGSEVRSLFGEYADVFVYWMALPRVFSPKRIYLWYLQMPMVLPKKWLVISPWAVRPWQWKYLFDGASLEN